MNYKIIGVLVILGIPACRQRTQGPYAKETAMFENYLQADFGKKIESDSATYVLVPSEACLGCIGGVLSTADLKAHVQIVAAEKAILRSNIQAASSSQLLVDEKNNIDRLPFHGGNIGLLQCVDGEIYRLSSYDANQMPDLLHIISP